MGDFLPGEAIPVWGGYLQLLRKYPIRTKSLTSCIVMVTAQLVSQKIVRGEVYNLSEVRFNMVWGLFLGTLNHFWQAFIQKNGPKNIFALIAVDHAIWKFNILYTFIVCQQLWYKRPLKEALAHSWKIAPQKQIACVFPLAQVLNFTIIPLPLRVLYMNTCLWFWSLYLAIRMNRASLAVTAKEKNAEEKKVENNR